MGNTPSVSAHLENARRTGVCSLTDMKLKEVPPEFFRLKQSLRTVDLSRNRLLALPGTIGEFKILKSLTVNQNGLGELPVELSKLSKLETFSAEHNSISSISQLMFPGLTNLKSISLCGNNLAHFPSGLCSLPKLDMINLSQNKIRQIPEEVGQYKGIEINLNKNRLNSLCPQLTECERLKVLRVEENCLPLTAISKDVLVNSGIAVLACDGNLFSSKELQDLDGYEKYMERFTATKKKFV